MTEVFPMVPASGKAVWLVAGIAGVLFLVLVALAYTAYSARTSRFEVSPEGLRISGDFWGRTLPYERLDLDAVRIVNLSKDSPYRPRLRTFGTGLPGYASGWFRLRNGSKALVYATSYARVVVLPTRDDYVLVLSPAEPERMVEALRRAAAS